MITRIVKMTFQHDKVNDFITAFEERRNLIGTFEGCSGVQLLRDILHTNVFFTYSHWKNEEALEKYRQSDLFNSTWAIVKPWFSDKPQAWSVKEVKPKSPINP